ENQPGDNFCGECGCNLSEPSSPALKELSFDDKIEQIQKYLPKGLTEKILSQRNKIEGERRQVTVLFCDMESSTSLIESLGPEQAYAIMDQVYEIMIHKVHDFEGTVNEMTGDGILALFGAPIAIENAAQRAIQAAQAIHRDITRFNDQKKQEGLKLEINMRIGIHTGPVVVGTLGNDLRVEFKAVGDTVIIASRLEDLAEPGTTFVTEDTFKLTEGLYRFESLGEKQVKGKEEPVKVYRVIATSTRRTRFDVSAERGLTSFIGRERELELLLDGFERAKSGRGQAFSIIAEAGIGKSRLLYEFRKAVANENVTFLEGKCLSFSRSQGYHPIVDILKSNFDIAEDDWDSNIRSKVQGWLQTVSLDEDPTLPYLLELLSVKDSKFDQINLSPEGKKAQTIEAIKRIVLKGSEVRPLILAVEDLHWSDKTSEEVMEEVLESIAGARVLLIFTYRPDFINTWGARSYHNQVTLNRLSNRESLSMASNILGTTDMAPDLEELILEKSDGIPFFIEEFIKSIQELGVIEKKEYTFSLTVNANDLHIPSTIQDVIMARIDTLPEDAKSLIQTMSAIEREVNYELIQKATDMEEQQLLTCLSVLKDAELVYERGIFPESVYIFRHALTREVVYGSILISKRRTLHKTIGEAMEDLYRDAIELYYGVLGEHFTLSENYRKAAEYAKLAARKSIKEALFIEAVNNSKNRVCCLEKLISDEEIEKEIIDARAALGSYYAQLTDFYEAGLTVEQILDLAVRHDNKKRLSQIYCCLGVYKFFIEMKFDEAVEYLEKAIILSKDSGNISAFMMAHHFLGHCLADTCNFKEGLHHIQEALKIPEKANILWGISMHKGCIGRTVYFEQGKIDLAYDFTTEGVRLSNECNDVYSKAEAYTSHGMSCYGKGYLEEAEQCLLQGIDFSNKSGFAAMEVEATKSLGEIYNDMMEYSKARNYWNRSKEIFKKLKFHHIFSEDADLAIIKSTVMEGKQDIDLHKLSKMSYEIDRVGYKRRGGLAKRRIAEILLHLHKDRTSEAEKWIIDAIEEEDKNGAMWKLARDYSFYSELLRQKGEMKKAKHYLGLAISTMKECGADGWVEKYDRGLAEFS
ncbi:MAG: AAA family ATPase, partial [Desulfobacteraceae bacterium]